MNRSHFISADRLRVRTATLLVLAFSLVFLSTQSADAQILKRRGKQEDSNTAQRRPNDQIEGTIWEYKSVKYYSQKEEGKPEPKLSGRFRIEGSGVFAVGQSLKIKSKADRKAKLKKLARDGGELSLNPGPQEKRIGDYTKRDGKHRLVFDDPTGLKGTMVFKSQRESKSVWRANYYQKDGKKTTGHWLVELRAIKD